MKKRILSLALVSVLFAGIFAACAPAGTQPPAGGAAPVTQQPAVPDGERTVGRGITVAHSICSPSITPGRHTSLAGHWINTLTHNGLFRRDEYMNAIPDIIEDWRPLSDTLFEFTLRPGIRFHNGDVMTAYDIEASHHFLRTFPEGAAMHTAVIGIEVVDRYTFILDTGEPNALMVPSLADQRNFIFPMSLIDAGHDFTEVPIGSGPFVFEEWDHGNAITFRRFEDYFDADRTARVEYIVWRTIPEGSTRTIALEMGEVDYLIAVASPDIPRLEADPNIVLFQMPGLTYNYLLFNHTLPQFESVYVRRAIDMALDKVSMVEAGFDGRALPVWESFPTIFPGVSREGIRSFDPEGARALLAANNIDPSTLDFEIIFALEEYRRMGEVAQANLADIGIRVTLSQVDNAAWLSQTAGGQHQAAFGNFTSDNVLGFLRNTMHLSFIGAQNRSQFYNREFSNLIDQAVATVDESARLALIYELTQTANEQAVWVPLCISYVIRAHTSSLIVPETNAFGFMMFNMVYWAE